MQNLFGEDLDKHGMTKEEREFCNLKRKWHKKINEWLWKEYNQNGDNYGRLMCGNDWLCNECVDNTNGRGIIPCKLTMLKIARNCGIKINYNDYDFEKLENKIREKYKEKK